MLDFKLSDEFVNSYRDKPVNWGYKDGAGNALGELVFLRTYSRKDAFGNKETWVDTCRRVIEGMFSIQKRHCRTNAIEWKNDKAQRTAKDAFDRLFHLKWAPAGRGLWAMGTPLVMDDGNSAPLQSCAYVSTRIGVSKSMQFLFDASMLGVGVGFDASGANKTLVREPILAGVPYAIPDSREGWVESLGLLLDAYLGTGKRVHLPEFDYRLIRPAGEPIKRFGGVASGPAPLKDMHERIKAILDNRVGENITMTDIADIGNIIGTCVVAGNVRRCLPEGTRVHLTDGIRNIEDVRVGDMVETSGSRARVTNVFDQGVQDTVVVRYVGGEIECTPNHQVAVFESVDSWTFKRADELTTEDRIVWDREGISGRDTHFPSYGAPEKKAHDTVGQELKIPDLDAESAWFIGMVHGDGYVFVPSGKTPNGSVSVASALDTPDIPGAVAQEMEKWGARAHIKPGRAGDAAIRISAYSSRMAEYFYENIKKPNESIEIPLWIKDAYPEIRMGYLAGLFDADGSYKTRPLQAVVTVYRSFAKQVAEMYASIGIQARVKLTSAAQGSYQDLYSVDIVGGHNIRAFENTVALYSLKYEGTRPFRSAGGATFSADMVRLAGLKAPDVYGKAPQSAERIEKLLDTHLPAIPYQVLEVIPSGRSVQTYDIEVEGIHQFTAEGVVVHNSAEIFFVDRDSDDLEDFIALKDYDKNPQRASHGFMCLPGDTWVHTDDGPKMISDLIGVNFNASIGGEVYASESAGFFCTSDSREVFTVTTKQGYSIRATDNHPIKTENGFVNLGDLEIGDKILVANQQYSPWVGTGGTFSEGYLVGAVWGDGTYTRDSRKTNTYRASILLYDGGADQAYTEYVEDQAREINPKARFGTPTKNGILQLRNKALTNLVTDYGFSEGKNISKTIEYASSDFYRGFIRAAFDADGSVSRYRKGSFGGQAILSQSSLSDLQTIQRMLGRLGIYSTIRKARKSSWGKKEPFTLAISARSLQDFSTHIGFAHSEKARKLAQILDIKKQTNKTGAPFFAEVADIYLSSVEPVYDVTISDVHEFDANGIVVHNSNNTVRVNVGDDLTPLLPGIKLNGEPGLVWMDLARTHGRLKDPADNKDWRAEGTNPCFPADTLLATEDGWISFGDAFLSKEPQRILVDGRVSFEESEAGKEYPEDWKIDLKTKYQPEVMQASEVFLTQENAPIVKVTLSNGIDLRCTPDHLIATKAGMVRADELSPEHKVLITRGFLPEAGRPDLTERENMDAFVIGLIAGDGYIAKGKLTENVYIDLWGPDKEIAPVITRWIEHLFEQFKGKYLSNSNRPFTPYIQEMREDRDQIRIHSSFLAAYLNGEYGFNKATKHTVPSQFISKAKSSSARAYVAGLAFADGTINKLAKVGSSNIRIGQINKSLLQDVQRILLANGIASSIYLRRKSRTTKIHGTPTTSKDFFELIVMMNSFEYTKYVGFGLGYKQEQASRLFTKQSRKQATYSSVVSVEDDGIEDVYCLKEPIRRVLSANGVTARRCGEQILESGETCNLAEIFTGNHESRDDLIKTMKVAYLYGKTVTLLPTKWEATNTIMQRNRRIGLSLSGVADFVDNQGLPKLRDMAEDGYGYVKRLDKKYSEWLCVRESIRRTTVKPSGSISILAGSSPGVHWTPGGEYFIRRITFAKTDPIFLQLVEAGYEYTPLDYDSNSAVVLFPVHSKSKRSSEEVPAWEKFHLAAEMQRWWSDNAVSCTVDFHKHEAEDIATLLSMYDGSSKGISLLPALEGGAYKNMPYERISKEEYDKMCETISKADFSVAYVNGEEAAGEKYCSTDVCETGIEIQETNSDVEDISHLI